MDRTPVADVVVLLPGITGSVLAKDGRDLWAMSGGALVRSLRTLGRSLRDLELHGDDLLQGKIIDSSDSGFQQDAFAVVEVEGLAQPIVVPMNRIKGAVRE